MPNKQSKGGKSEAVTPVALAQTNTKWVPDPFIEGIGNGYAERNPRERWAEIEALLRAEVGRARPLYDPGSQEPDKGERAKKCLQNAAVLMMFMFGLETVDLMLRDAATDLLAGEGIEKSKGYVEYGQRVLQDHWAQLRGRLRADIEHIRGSCIYGRMGSLPGGFRKRQGTVADDIEEYIRQIEVLMEDFVWFEIATADEYLGHVADILEARSHLSAERDQKEGQEPAAH
jgi:hypothetical protein